MSSFTSRLEVTPLDDGRRWRLIRAFPWGFIVVPVGFITDFASVPRLFWWLVSPWGKYGKAAIVHDFLYQKHGYYFDGSTIGTWVPVDRWQADHEFLLGMVALGAAPWRRKLMYWGVRLFGWLAWK